MSEQPDAMQAILAKLDALDSRLNNMEAKKKKKPRSEQFCQLKSKQMKEYHANMRSFRDEANALRKKQELEAEKKADNLPPLTYPMQSAFSMSHLPNIGFGF
jgi:hypothetical protein